MILIDEPHEYQVKGLMRGRKFKSSHMISTRKGAEGTRELVAFGRKIGMREQWLQKPGTIWEHFDVMNTRYQVAVDAGARERSSRKVVKRMLMKGASKMVALSKGVC